MPSLSRLLKWNKKFLTSSDDGKGFLGDLSNDGYDCVSNSKISNGNGGHEILIKR